MGERSKVPLIEIVQSFNVNSGSSVAGKKAASAAKVASLYLSFWFYS
jgi:hypothetical protein